MIVLDDVGVVQLLQKRNLSDGSAWHSLLFRFQPDPLQRNDQI